tara:strand:- start:26241 stop:26990 length:750 start_codon:yes stop_codon:yes gene_type:complete
MTDDTLLDMLNEALSIADDADPSYELSLVKTKIQEAIMWYGAMTMTEPQSKFMAEMAGFTVHTDDAKLPNQSKPPSPTLVKNTEHLRHDDPVEDGWPPRKVTKVKRDPNKFGVVNLELSCGHMIEDDATHGMSFHTEFLGQTYSCASCADEAETEQFEGNKLAAELRFQAKDNPNMPPVGERYNGPSKAATSGLATFFDKNKAAADAAPEEEPQSINGPGSPSLLPAEHASEVLPSQPRRHAFLRGDTD